jgi:hypothetical protein
MCVRVRVRVWEVGVGGGGGGGCEKLLTLFYELNLYIPSIEQSSLQQRVN